MSLVAVAIRSAPRLVTRFPPYCSAFSGNHLHTVGFLAGDDQQSTLASQLFLRWLGFFAIVLMFIIRTNGVWYGLTLLGANTL
jgi:hypothetical protein